MPNSSALYLIQNPHSDVGVLIWEIKKLLDIGMLEVSIGIQTKIAYLF